MVALVEFNSSGTPDIFFMLRTEKFHCLVNEKRLHILFLFIKVTVIFVNEYFDNTLKLSRRKKSLYKNIMKIYLSENQFDRTNGIFALILIIEVLNSLRDPRCVLKKLNTCHELMTEIHEPVKYSVTSNIHLHAICISLALGSREFSYSRQPHVPILHFETG